jgi:hypothetical protein
MTIGPPHWGQDQREVEGSAFDEPSLFSGGSWAMGGRSVECPSNWKQRGKRAAGQHVEQEAPQELLDRKDHQALLVAVRGVSPAEGDPATFHEDQAVIGDRHPVSVAAEITENLFRTRKRRFTVDHPVLTVERAEERSESLGFCQKLQVP